MAQLHGIILAEHGRLWLVPTIVAREDRTVLGDAGELSSVAADIDVSTPVSGWFEVVDGDVLDGAAMSDGAYDEIELAREAVRQAERHLEGAFVI